MTITQNRLWTVEEYHRMMETGILTTDDQVELLEGCIVQMSPQRPPHAGTTQRAVDYLKIQWAGHAQVRMQLPITLSKSEPEPDIAVVQIDPNAYGDHHPTPDEIFLLIEVADTTLAIDRDKKGLIYAKANITDYWILDIKKRQVYVLQHPTPTGYQSEMILDTTATLAPLAFPEILMPVAALFLP